MSERKERKAMSVMERKRLAKHLSYGEALELTGWSRYLMAKMVENGVVKPWRPYAGARLRYWTSELLAAVDGDAWKEADNA